ncbi:hypothetical protein AQUCO_01500461v1 [Aquilegia coerulea]|uniref:Cysteine proteinase inhibitor n=1 Tax=Aquilegia coerulea TaxID=218851 RepID=A0A2G5DTT7_AQUCA|nr:hypothetical protein AQUCO_01500461v1 [Aquilegia coerulea]
MEGVEGVGCSGSGSGSRTRDNGKWVISHTSKLIKKGTKKKKSCSITMEGRAALTINRYQFKEDCDFSEAIRLGQFAVDDENRKTRGMIRELVFLSVEHVVRESTITSDIYYLTIKAKSFDENQPMFFKTAVRVPNQKQYPIESVGLIYSEENKVQLPGVILLQNDDIEVHTVAEFAVKVHNGNSVFYCFYFYFSNFKYINFI